ncbi:MAG TPA: thiol-disulfide isomerase [Bryobacteraceae bacterium]
MNFRCAALLSAALMGGASTMPAAPTFSREVAPILQKHCQQCHRPGEIAPMSLLTYSDARPWAKAIRQAVVTKKMPPWFADPRYGHFSNDSSLAAEEIAILTKWVDAGAPEGNASDLPKPMAFADGWSIGKPDLVLEMPKALPIPATGTLDIIYLVVPADFNEDRWVQAAEVRPGNRALVHHINAILRTPDQRTLRNLAPGEPYTPPKNTKFTPPPDGSQPDSEFFVGYVPGLQGKRWPDGQAKFIPKGSDFIFQIHYSTNGTAGKDQSRIGLIFSKQPPKERVLSAVAKNWTFAIPAGATHHEVRSMIELGSDVTLVSLQPHMHYRGRDYEYKAIYPSGETEVLLRVPNYDFNWQLTYFLEKPKLLPRGTRIECTAHYDNSANNPANPDPKATVTYGEQSWDEMMSGWMEVGFDPAKSAKDLFVVRNNSSQAATH